MKKRKVKFSWLAITTWDTEDVKLTRIVTNMYEYDKEETCTIDTKYIKISTKVPLPKSQSLPSPPKLWPTWDQIDSRPVVGSSANSAVSGLPSSWWGRSWSVWTTKQAWKNCLKSHEIMFCVSKLTQWDTVDRRNSAPPNMHETLNALIWYVHISADAGFLPSAVWLKLP